MECVINISEGRNAPLIGRIAGAGGRYLLDVHRDPDHNRSVLTLAGPPDETQAAARRVAAATVAALDITTHTGVHPRIGVLDVVPFVALERRAALHPAPLAAAVTARDAFAAWAAAELALPCFLYGPLPSGGEGTLPEVRRRAWRDLSPDVTPGGIWAGHPRLAGTPAPGQPTSHAPGGGPHPTAGAAAVGARPPLVAYNLWLGGAGADLGTARQVAARIRRPGLRTLGLAVGGAVQVSCNLVDPWRLGPGAVFDAVASEATALGATVVRAELVGLVPEAVLRAEPARRWTELGLEEASTIEARLEGAGLDPFW